MTKKIAVSTLTLLLLSGCVNWTDPAQLRTRQEDYLCSSYAISRMTGYTDRVAAIRTEIERRHAVAPEDWQTINEGEIRNGMSSCALLASWGFPDAVNNTVTVAGHSAQYVFGNGRYVYTTNGRVTEFQY